MRSLLIYFLFIATSSFGQIEVHLFFASSCDNSVNRLEFELYNLDFDSVEIHSKNGVALVQVTGTYHITAYQSWSADRIGFCYYTIDIPSGPTFVDTLSIPRIKYTSDGVLHSRYWNYFNCDKLCDGFESDLFPNGHKRLDGKFKNGKPKYIIEYRMDGTKEAKYWYLQGTPSYSRVDYFDLSGTLDKYDKYKYKKHRTVRTVYTAKGEMFGRDILKH